MEGEGTIFLTGNYALLLGRALSTPAFSQFLQFKIITMLKWYIWLGR
jgi:hypothetical protein